MKNPFLSLWLSQANACAGVVRGFWAGEMKRQQTAMISAMSGKAGAKPRAKGKKRPSRKSG
ncbi:hypothetical protein [Indioceanicola profundi]|uniref:hypothetical protein n=1 Tax=Indioceanicola profundi TaxID=2220096 RepID=UPI000E6AB8CE|nr:hypothetical protein [Indioceanicola profundi]